MSAVSDRQKHKIALYIGSLRKGGAERVMGNLAEYLWERGWEVVLVTTYFAPPEYVLPHGLWDPETGAPGESGESGIRRIYSEPKEEELRGNRVANFKTRCRTLRDIWEAERPDVILSFLNTCNNMALFTARGLGIPDENPRLPPLWLCSRRHPADGGGKGILSQEDPEAFRDPAQSDQPCLPSPPL